MLAFARPFFPKFDGCSDLVGFLRLLPIYQIFQGTSDGLHKGPAIESFGTAIPKRHDMIRVGDDDGIADLIEQGRLDPEMFLGQIVTGDVQEQPDPMRDSTRLIFDGCYTKLCLVVGPVFSAAGEEEGSRIRPANSALKTSVLVGIGCEPEGTFETVSLNFGGGVAGHGHERGIEINDLVFRIPRFGNNHCGRRGLGCCFKKSTLNLHFVALDDQFQNTSEFFSRNGLQ